MATDEEKFRQDAFRAEYAIVANTWHTLQRERVLLTGTALTTLGILAGAYAAGIRLIGALDESRSIAALVPIVPGIGAAVIILVWVTDVWFQRAQQIARARGAALESRLGLQNALFAQLYTWRMPQRFNVQIREAVCITLLLICAIAYIPLYRAAQVTETVVQRQSARSDSEKPQACNCNCSCLSPLTPRLPQSIMPGRKE